MYDTNEVTITLRLPPDIAEQAIEVQRTDPEFLSRVVLYGLTRRSIYRQLRDRNKGPAMTRISPEEGERILAENEDRLVRETMFPDPVEEEAKLRALPAENSPIRWGNEGYPAHAHRNRHRDDGAWADKAGE